MISTRNKQLAIIVGDKAFEIKRSLKLDGFWFYVHFIHFLMITEESKQAFDLSIEMADEKWKKLTIEERKKWGKHAIIINKSKEFQDMEKKYKQTITATEKREFHIFFYYFMKFIYLYFRYNSDSIFDK